MVVKLDKKHYTYSVAVITGAIVVSLLIGFFALRRAYTGNVKTAKEVKDKREILSVLEDKLDRLKELKSQEKELLEEKDKVLVALPEEKDVPRLFVEFDKMITDTGAYVESAKEDSATNTSATGTEAKSMPGVVNHNYTLQVTTSTYESIKNIIDNIEEARRLLNLKDITIDQKDDGFTLTLGVNAFSRENSKTGGTK